MACVPCGEQGPDCGGEHGPDFSVRLLAAAPAIATSDAACGARDEDEHPRGPAERPAQREADVEAGMDFLGKFEPNYFLLGNHDDRLWQTAEKHSVGIVRDTARMGIRDISSKCRKLKCKMLPYDVEKGVLSLGKINFVHGYFHGAVSATKQHALTFSPKSGCCIHGHIHSVQMHSIPRLGGGCALSAGCLTTLSMGWNRAKVNRLAHEAGWVYGWFSNKSWAAHHARRFEGKWLWA